MVNQDEMCDRLAECYLGNRRDKRLTEIQTVVHKLASTAGELSDSGGRCDEDERSERKQGAIVHVGHGCESESVEQVPCQSPRNWVEGGRRRRRDC